ncbi:hypothetical protein [uncultured Helicobacter sp.]
MQPDSLHLHTLIFVRFSARKVPSANAKTSLLIIAINAPFMLLSVLCYEHTALLIVFSLAFVLLYTLAYRAFRI